MPSLDLEGARVPIHAGDTVASVLFRSGVRTFSRSFKYHRPRGLYCLSGDCPNCLLTVDGEPCVRACVTPAREGMRVRRERGWPSVERDALSLLWHLRGLLPVGFYYKTFLHPRFAWGLTEPLVRGLAGLGPAPLGLERERREASHVHCDLLVAGGGEAGVTVALDAAASGERVVLADEGLLDPGRASALSGRVRVLERAAVVGVYEGPLVPVDAPDLLYLVHPKRVAVATGAVELHAVFPGSDLPGVWLGRGAARLAREHRLAPGRRVVYQGVGPESLDHLFALSDTGAEIVACLPAGVAYGARVSRLIADGTVVQAHGRDRVRGATVEAQGRRERISCDAVVVSLGLVPRDGLLRQAAGLPVTSVGDAALTVELPPAPASGFACPCEDVSVHDLERAYAEGFRSTELLKRYTTATMGPCQGALCLPHLRALVGSLGGGAVLSGPTTSRPPARAIRLQDAAAGVALSVEHRTALHERHLALGARMEWAGAWKRPEEYGDPLAEYWAVRRDVGLMDVGTLGKLLVAGPDAATFLERVYPCWIVDLAPGRVRYTVLLNEAGFVFDDGTIAALPDGRYGLTVTSSGADAAEAWLRDWAETWGCDVYIANETVALGAINVSGPKARTLLDRLVDEPIDTEHFPYLHWRELDIAGVRCRALRLGFTGELSYELHHPRSQSVQLWDALLDAGGDLGVRAHGLQALRLLRLEKGHVIIGQDSDFDSTPAKLGLSFAVRMDKPGFVGKAALDRLGALDPAQRLVKLAFAGATSPPEGTPLRARGQLVGHLTSAGFSPALGHGVALGWLNARDGRLATEVEADGLPGTITEQPFYDPEGLRLRA